MQCQRREVRTREVSQRGGETPVCPALQRGPSDPAGADPAGGPEGQVDMDEHESEEDQAVPQGPYAPPEASESPYAPPEASEGPCVPPPAADRYNIVH